MMNAQSKLNESIGESDDNSKEKSITLPEPDRDNITVLTENLPNKPILPWNRYDSDWDEMQEGEKEKEAKVKADEASEEVESARVDAEEIE
jgi:hypothetical protein